jgi:DNA-directed RNA polymerase subunit RPC12/RpoP
MRIKRVRCHDCGGPKVLPATTAYVYCDWCGRLTDWDFAVATRTMGSRDPGPHYEALRVYLHPKMEEAKLRGDRGAFNACQRQLFEEHVKACPAAYSPRVKDEHYRGAILGFSAAMKTLEAFEAELRGRAAQIVDARKKMRWENAREGGIARSDTFWKLFAATFNHAQASAAWAKSTGMLARHPDAVTPELFARIEVSAFAQEWLGHLSQADGDRLLRDTGLAGDYVEAETVDTEPRPCSRCGATLTVARGARHVLCESCGAIAAVGGVSVPCGACGARVEMEPGATRAACAYCRAEVRRDA